MSEHAILSASASPRWIICPGSVAATQGLPDNAGDSARWGTAAHTVAGWCLEDGHMAKAYEGREIVVQGHTYVVDEDMLFQVQTYIDIVRALVKEHNGKLLVEQQVNYSHLFHQELIEQHGEQFGTGDAVVLCDDRVIVVDLKTGRTVVEPTSSQLAMYALGVLEEHDPDGVIYGWDRIDTIIVQPPHSTRPQVHTYTREELQAVADKAAVSGNCALSLIGKPIEELTEYLVPGEHCGNYYCKARATCPKLRALVAESVFGDEAAFEQSAETRQFESPAEPEGLARVLKLLPVIRDWVEQMQERAYGHALAGGELPGFKLVAGKKGARKWRDEAEAEQVLKSMRLKQDEMYTFKLISPTQAEKLLKESPRRWNKAEVLIEQADGKPVLVPETDKGEPLRIAPVVDQFENLDAVGIDVDDLI